MNLIIHEVMERIFTSYQKELENIGQENKDISEFILNIKKGLDEIGTMLVAEALETLDEAYRASPLRKKNWSIKSKADPKTLSTIFGDVKYKRSYYINKQTKEYSYLSDESVGIEDHDRLDASLKSKLIEESIVMPYKRSGEKATETTSFSPQTVMNSIRELGKIENNTLAIKEKKTVKTLYIEADEDHVALQIGGIIEPKLIYVHEGKEEISKGRMQLKNVRYFSGVYPRSDDLWLEVADYLDQAYELDKTKTIYLSGDGAPWIKNGLGWIKGSIYVLDRYHLSKYVTTATAHQRHTTAIMWNYINNQDKENLKKLFKEIIKTTEVATKRQAVKEARRYILNNWEGIKNQYKDDYIGCSAEGHISHILSARLSSRPLGWSKTGVDQMSRLRAYMANGGKIYPLLMQKKQETAKEARQIKIDQEILRKRKLIANSETLGNITMFNIGKRTGASKLLQSFRGA